MSSLTAQKVRDRLARMTREVAVVRAEERAAADPVSRKKRKPDPEEK